MYKNNMFGSLHTILQEKNESQWCEQNNWIIVLFDHEGIPIIETMAPAFNRETVKCWLVSMCSIYEWYMSVKKLRSFNKFWSVWSRNWEDSSDFKLFDIWKVIYNGLNGTGPQNNFDITVFLIYKVWYIWVCLTYHFDIHHVFVKTEFDIYKFIDFRTNMKPKPEVCNQLKDMCTGCIKRSITYVSKL